jgi:3-dehydroquinate synthase
VSTVNIDLGKRSYPVIIGSGLLDQAALWREHLPGGKILVVSNEVVAPLYLERLISALGIDVQQTMILPDGESSKTVSNWSLIIDRLIEMRAGRDVCLLALGGGVVGDICGFAAATYMRGVPFIQVPTTLLAQVDASVGGKTAVNHVRGKNLVGAFHQPRAVIADTDTLDTLPDREFSAGMAEVVKYGAIRDAAFFDWLETESANIQSKNPAALISLIEKSVRNKAAVVAEDELETGARALLNFGHTFGHALETVTAYSRFLHGEAVAIGMAIAARLSESRGLCGPDVSTRLARLLAMQGLPVTLPADLETEAIMDAMTLDKKRLGGKTRLVLLTALGKAIIDSDSPADQIRGAIEASR